MIAIDLLENFANELRRIYGTNCEVDSALHQWSTFLAAQPKDNHMFFGRGDPNDSQSTFQYWGLMGDLADKSARDGENSRRLRRMGIVLAYTYWEVETRPSIANIVGVQDKDVAHPAFGDLNKLRQAVVHVNGRIDRNLEVFKFVKKGDRVDLSNDQFYELFKTLIHSLNEIGEVYLGIKPEFSFDRKFQAPAPEPRTL